MSVRYLSLKEVEKLAGSIWYAPRMKAVRCGDEKLASMPAFSIDGHSTEFPLRNGEWTLVGKYSMMIEYPMWDIPGNIHVRKASKPEPETIQVQPQMCEYCKQVPAISQRGVLLAQDASHPTMDERTPTLWLCEHCQGELIGAFPCQCKQCKLTLLECSRCENPSFTVVDGLCKTCREEIALREREQESVPQPEPPLTKDEEPCYKDWCPSPLKAYCSQCGRAGCQEHLLTRGRVFLCYDCEPNAAQEALVTGMKACGQVGQYIVEAEAEIAHAIREQPVEEPHICPGCGKSYTAQDMSWGYEQSPYTPCGCIKWQQLATLTTEQLVAWASKLFQEVPSYCEGQAEQFVAEPEAVSLATFVAA